MTTLGAEFGRLQPSIYPADILALPPDDQFGLLIETAGEYVQSPSDVSILAEVTTLIPGQAYEVQDAYQQVITNAAANPFGIWALRKVSLSDKPFAGDAWDRMVTVAQQRSTGDVARGSYRQHPLEFIAEGQIDPSRLDQLKRLASSPRYQGRFEQGLLLCAIAKQEATFNISAAHNTRMQLYPGKNKYLIDSATVAIVEGASREGMPQMAYDETENLSSYLMPWGYLKIFKHHHDEDSEDMIETVRQGLAAHWRRYDDQQKEEIINDLLITGNHDLAFNLLMGEPRHPLRPVNRQRDRLLLDIVIDQANTDMPQALAMLDAREAAIIETLDKTIEDGMRIEPTSPTYNIDEITNRVLRQDYLRELDTLAMYRTALSVPSDLTAALAMHERAAFFADSFGDDVHPQLLPHKEYSRKVMAIALANAGHIPEALEQVAAMTEDRLLHAEKALALIAIARAIRWRQKAEPAHK